MRFSSNNKAGYTLVELVVAATLLSTVVVSALSLYNLFLQGQSYVLAARSMQESLRYMLEAWAREIRSAQANDGTCPAGGTNKIFNLPSSSRLYFRNKNGKCVQYRYNSANKRVEVSKTISSSIEDFLSITPQDIIIDDVRFFVRDNPVTATPNTLQPRVTVTIKAHTTKSKFIDSKSFVFQTTVSTRHYQQ
ncbi:hypothetical protein D6821_01385 [Candidatus Parcubacteria bacterium]|nr:MAG: hypothetical protein D6821_01385 [Candidatus Parcubacteria bacterium]